MSPKKKKSKRNYENVEEVQYSKVDNRRIKDAYISPTETKNGKGYQYKKSNSLTLSPEKEKITLQVTHRRSKNEYPIYKVRYFLLLFIAKVYVI